MDKHSEQQTLIPTQKQEAQQPLVIEYADLVNTIQLSVARQINLPGALEAESLGEVLITATDAERNSVICEIGQHFDEALINFVMCAVIARHKRQVIITADEHEGINGYLPWEEQLARRIAEAKENNTLSNVDVRVERTRKLEASAGEFGTIAARQTLELV